MERKKCLNVDSWRTNDVDERYKKICAWHESIVLRGNGVKSHWDFFIFPSHRSALLLADFIISRIWLNFSPNIFRLLLRVTSLQKNKSHFILFVLRLPILRMARGDTRLSFGMEKDDETRRWEVNKQILERCLLLIYQERDDGIKCGKKKKN